jgi:hypothetical protein
VKDKTISSPAPAPTISIDVTQDLESLSALKTMLSSHEGAIFHILGELNKYALQPVSVAAQAQASAKISLSGAANWTTSNGIGFSLTPTASCAIGISTAGTSFDVAMSVDSPQTQKIAATAPPGTNTVYVNIDLDFDIQGSVSGSGNIGSLGIAGKASGGVTATLSFCQPVDAGTQTLAAIQKAFSGLVFPLDPECAEAMVPGSLAKVSFDATFKCQVSATYGLAEHKISAPSLSQMPASLQNLQKVVQVTVPTLDITAGIKGSVKYAHADHFGLIVTKTDSATAFLYLVRSASNDVGVSVGVTLGITATDPSVTIDTTALQSMVGQVTGSSTVASAVASAAGQPLNQLETSLNAKLKSWVADVTGQTGLTVSLDRQSSHTALFTFKVNLAAADLAAQSWAALVGGSVPQALAIQGFTLQPGSGVADSLKRSSTIQFHFFNLYSFSSTTDYFSNAYTELGPDGTIRVFRDVGQEQQTQTKTALAKFRIHFVATATEDTLHHVNQAKVDLYVELSEKSSSKYAGVLSQTVGLIPANPAVHLAQTKMAGYVAANPQGTLTLINIIKSSAYRKLTCSAYQGGKPPALPHEQDLDNWDAFQAATESLMPNIGFVPDMSFAFWMDFNRAANDQVGSTMIPDRRHPGAWGAVPPSFFEDRGISANVGPLVAYFFLASGAFMNLCDDLQTLAVKTNPSSTTTQWNDLLNFLTQLVTKDVFIDYAKPTAGALLHQCSVAGAQVTTVADESSDSSSLTCTLTLA